MNRHERRWGKCGVLKPRLGALLKRQPIWKYSGGRYGKAELACTKECLKRHGIHPELGADTNTEWVNFPATKGGKKTPIGLFRVSPGAG